MSLLLNVLTTLEWRHRAAAAAADGGGCPITLTDSLPSRWLNAERTHLWDRKVHLCARYETLVLSFGPVSKPWHEQRRLDPLMEYWEKREEEYVPNLTSPVPNVTTGQWTRPVGDSLETSYSSSRHYSWMWTYYLQHTTPYHMAGHHHIQSPANEISSTQPRTLTNLSLMS